jgi:foldase protein PrsA
MSDSTQTNVSENPRPKRAKAAWIAAGTAVVVIVAAVAFQVLRPREGAAGENSPDDAGRASMSSAMTHQPLARVNGELVSYDVVAAECMQRYGQEVLESMVNRTIIHQACAKDGIEIHEDEVRQEIVKIAKKFDIDPQNWLRVIQTERHMSPLQYEQDVIWPMLALKRLAGQDIQVTEEEMQRVFVRDYGERVKARMILCDKLHRAQEAWAAATKDPQNFGKIARERSIDPTSKSLDGQIQPIRRFAGNDNLEREAFKLKDGEISGIIDVSTPEAQRYVILLCEGRTVPIVKTIDDPGIRKEVLTQLTDEKTQLAVAKVFEKLKKEAVVDNFLTNTSTHGVAQTGGTSEGEGRGRVNQAGGYRPRLGTVNRSADASDGQQQQQPQQ